MEADYPAAHSMDSCWFAVDADGRVGVFSTGENGHVPQGHQDITDAIRDVYRPVGVPDGEWYDLWEHYPVSEMCHFSYFEGFEWYEEFLIVDPYRCAGMPEPPLHIDQLPPELRKLCRWWRFPIRFQAEMFLQPLEFIPCWAYNPDSEAYRCADGKTIKPFPGTEEEFDEFVRDLLEQHPEAAKDLIFDGPTTGSP